MTEDTMGRRIGTGADTAGTSLASTVWVLLLVVVLFLTFGGASRVHPVGFVGIAYWQDSLNVFLPDGEGWTVSIHEGCRFLVVPPQPGKMPELRPAADPNGERTDEWCRDIYTRPAAVRGRAE